MQEFDLSLVDWSRAQFALTAMYHWIFVPLTLGLSFIVAFMHTMYYKTGSAQWKNITKFWMKLFGVNFAIGVATGIILEFEFGSNWSNYSWFVGDIFGAPLAVEGIFAFFLESTFIAVMFFGWGRVSKKFHMLSSWLVAFGSNLSALWILVANAWMQDPVGMKFNPDTARNEMESFWDVLLSPSAVHKFLHTITSSYMVGAAFVIGVSSWYILRKRHILFAKKSILIASIFGMAAGLFTVLSGDQSAYNVANKQPMKFAAMEGLYYGERNADLMVFGIKPPGGFQGDKKEKFYFPVEVPVLSFMAKRDFNAFVPGIYDLLDGNKKEGIIAIEKKMEMGKKAINALKSYKEAKKEGDSESAEKHLITLNQNFKYFGYGYFKDRKEAVPNVGLSFYSFHLMVGLGVFLLYLFFKMIRYSLHNKLERRPRWLKLGIIGLPVAFICSQLGWVVAEVGRQPWVIQDLMPTKVATSHLSTGSVQITFFMFLALFTVLLIAELKIMIKQIAKGPKEI